MTVIYKAEICNSFFYSFEKDKRKRSSSFCDPSNITCAYCTESGLHLE